MVLENTTVDGDKLVLCRQDLEVQREACIKTMAQYKAEHDPDMYIFSMGHLAAINDLLNSFAR